MKTLLARISATYVAGPRLEDALRVATRLHANGVGTTLGYWTAKGQDSADARAEARAAAGALAAAGLDCYLSVKAPDLDFDLGGLDGPVPVHLDALRVYNADATLRLAEREGFGVTLPGRWRRSRRDAERVGPVRVRVVKGQFPCAAEERDPAAGLLDVVDALAGRTAFVAVATHDPPLAAEALRRLRAAGTPCGLELLFGLPMPSRLLDQDTHDLRVYVPYGTGYLPYAARQALRHPRIGLMLAEDLLRTAAHRGSKTPRLLRNR